MEPTEIINYIPENIMLVRTQVKTKKKNPHPRCREMRKKRAFRALLKKTVSLKTRQKGGTLCSIRPLNTALLSRLIELY
ncbi:MAG: hypothetical protein IAA96_08285 [Spirochaetes bacterium]|uniref:Uncharacterized protein n=1 Tax=Candidatus Avitreponema avistercoris TaxID=2840705 RepID=A0A9D9EN01_9SPIR|nr:hypothetical protein [Candidatus Avitreponema avistercoris]